MWDLNRSRILWTPTINIWQLIRYDSNWTFVAIKRLRKYIFYISSNFQHQWREIISKRILIFSFWIDLLDYKLCILTQFGDTIPNLRFPFSTQWILIHLYPAKLRITTKCRPHILFRFATMSSESEFDWNLIRTECEILCKH